MGRERQEAQITRPIKAAFLNELVYLGVSILVSFQLVMTNRIDFDFKILTALKGWVGHAPTGRGALHIIIFWFY